jgi:hypothetical protein
MPNLWPGPLRGAQSLVTVTGLAPLAGHWDLHYLPGCCALSQVPALLGDACESHAS